MSDQPSSVSDERLVFAFYGIDPSPKASERFFLVVSEWFTQLGYLPDRLGVVGDGHSGRVGEYRRTKSRLENVGFSDVKAFDIHACKPNAGIPAMEYLASASFSHSEDDGGFAVVAVPSSRANEGASLAFTRTMMESVHPAYGIGFARPLHLGPIKYALGICQGLGVGLTGDAEDEARNISRWCDTGMVKQVYRDGLLREVYRWNFLNRSQLSKQIGGLSLEQWIRQGVCRGKLHPSFAGLSCWEVSEGDIPAIRQALRHAGTIFDWRNYR